MKLLNFKPSRDKVIGDDDLVSDLDALIETPIAFRVLGKVHRIRPIKTSEFFKIINSLDKLNKLNRADKFTDEQLLEAYTELITSVCETITKKDILRMSQSQVSALIQLIIDTISGRAHAELEKKKKNLYRTERLNPSQPDPL